MIIHVVVPGESLFSIARKYKVSVESIVSTNEVNTNQNLVVGQTLVIPGAGGTYTIKPGENLWTVARKFNVTVESIVELNNIDNPASVYPGLTIRIPAKSKNYGFIEVNGYIRRSDADEAAEILNDVGEYLTYVSAFSYEVRENASLNPMRDEEILQNARKFRVAPLMVVTNLRNDAFDTALINKIMTDDALQQTLINNILQVLRTKGYYGVTIDFERIAPQNRERYNNFLRKLVAALKPQGFVTSTALAPKTYDITEGSWHGAHDYRAHGQIVDFVILMTYEWGWSGGPPLPVAPINEVRKVLDYAISVMDPKKILMGMALYGYDWTLPYVPGGEYARAISPQRAIEIAARYNARIQYDAKAQAPFFNYRDEQGRQHIVWFDDARSVEAKFKMASRLGLRGVSYWALGLDFPQNWAVLDSMFKITKVVQGS